MALPAIAFFSHQKLIEKVMHGPKITAARLV